MFTGFCHTRVTGRWRQVCPLVVFVMALLVVRTPTAAQSNLTVRSPAGTDLFAEKAVRTFKLEIVGEELESLKKDNRRYVRATFRDGTNTFTNVAVHLKGMGSFRPLHEKPSFAVRFDKFDADQTFRGLSKIMLNNSSQDRTYLAEYISTSLFRDAGLPAARVTHAFVELNGRDLGLYVLIEAMNRDFLRQHFRSVRGNLYEAYTQDIDQQLDQDAGKPSDQADRKKLVEVAKIPDAAERWEKLHQILDVDEFLSFLALEMFVGHTDGYAMNRNNYRLYHDPYSDRFVFITHGLDWGFSNPGLSIWPPLNSILVRAVLDSPQGKARYAARVSELLTNALNATTLTNRVAEMASKLKAAARTPAEAAEWSNEAAGLRDRIVQRARKIADEVSTPPAVPVKFDDKGVAHLSNWRSKIDAGEPKPSLTQQSIDGCAALHIRAEANGCVASWRSHVYLDAGKYQFAGRVKTLGVIPRPGSAGAGAGLRMSKGKRTDQLIGDTTWTGQEFSFELPSASEVDLVCELRAEKGEVWFDLDSLRLVKRN
jgi:spore coat protein H